MNKCKIICVLYILIQIIALYLSVVKNKSTMLTIQQIKEYGKISGNTLTEHFPMSSVKRHAISLLEHGIELYPEDWDTNDKYMIGISFKVKTYWFSMSIFESSDLENCQLFFDHSYNGNTGQIIKGFNQGYEVEQRILNKLEKVAEKSAA